MDSRHVQQVRRFNRLVTQRVGALDDSYLSRGRPLAEARLIFETGAHGADARALRGALGLDSGYLSRLLRSLKAQGLIALPTTRRVDILRPDLLARLASADRDAPIRDYRAVC